MRAYSNGSSAAQAANAPAAAGSSMLAATTTTAAGPGRAGNLCQSPGPPSPRRSPSRVGALVEDPVDKDLPLRLIHLSQYEVGNLMTVVPGHLRDLAKGDDA